MSARTSIRAGMEVSNTTKTDTEYRTGSVVGTP